MTMKTKSPAAGTRPEGARDEAEASRRVRDLFSQIVPRYDFLNHLLSFSCDRWWRRRTARRMRTVLRPGARVLDVCCGTGDLAFALEHAARDAGARIQIYGSDFVHGMLASAGEKAARRGSDLRLVCADTLQLPFASGKFELVSAAFGFRNLANYAAGIAELRRVMRPGGWLAILEFSEPTGAVFGQFYRFYFRRILPAIGGLFSGNRGAYGYLPASVSRFPTPAELAQLMRETGFEDVTYERWMGGIVALHLARRPEGSAGNEEGGKERAPA